MPPINRRNTRICIPNPACFSAITGPTAALRTDAGFPREQVVEQQEEAPQRLAHLPERAQPRPRRPVPEEAAQAPLPTSTACRHTVFTCATLRAFSSITLRSEPIKIGRAHV